MKRSKDTGMFRRTDAGPPDFIGVGAEGPGPAWWLAALLDHPEIKGPRGRRHALDFFRPFCARELRGADVADYHRAFPPPGRRLRGEWTGSYMCDGWVPPLLARAAPEARLLVMLGDPVALFRSVHAERVVAREKGRRLFITDVVDRSRHALQLARLRRWFESERILVLQLERCLQDPRGEYARTLRFLGVRDDVVPPALRDGRAGLLRRRPARPVAAAAPALWPDLEDALRNALEPDVRALGELVPEFDASLWPECAKPAAVAPAGGTMIVSTRAEG